jgi:hypothetical protein
LSAKALHAVFAPYRVRMVADRATKSRRSATLIHCYAKRSLRADSIIARTDRGIHEITLFSLPLVSSPLYAR